MNRLFNIDNPVMQFLSKMFDLIAQNIYYDFGMIYSSSITGIGTHLGHFWRSLFQNKLSNFISEYEKSGASYQIQLGGVIEMLTE